MNIFNQYTLLSLMFSSVLSASAMTTPLETPVSVASNISSSAISPTLVCSQSLLSQQSTILNSEEVTSDSSCYAFNNPANKVKHPWRAAIETFGINVGVQSFDRYIMNADFAQISLSTIRHNIKNGFVWDNDQFSTNLFAHPYHGGLYFNAARTNGLNFWESIPYSFCGSLMWETTCEIEPPAINDLMATTIGGICLGEVTHRISDLVYDDRKRGFARFAREFLGTLVCPIRGLNRIISGDAWRVRRDYYSYHDYEAIPIDFKIATGFRFLSDNNALFRGETNPFVNMGLVYGDAFDTENNKPYDYFTADVSFGLSANQPLINGVHLLGRLWGAPIVISDYVDLEFGLFQHFNYFDSKPVKDGSNIVPYRISEAAAFGPGLIYKFREIGNLSRLEQRIFFDAIILGGSLSDYYNVIDRDYNMGSGYSAKLNTFLEFGKLGSFSMNIDYYRIFTWKGYENKDMSTTNPLYLNSQGDKSVASLLVVTPRITLSLTDKISLDISASYFFRDTRYTYYENVSSRTFDRRLGLIFSI